MTTKTDFDLVLKSGKVLLPNGETITDIGIKDEKICHIGDLSNSQLSCGEENIIDCKNFHVLPGVIDSQVHFREPGLENKENLEFGMMAAAAGGVRGYLKCLILIHSL